MPLSAVPTRPSSFSIVIQQQGKNYNNTQYNPVTDSTITAEQVKLAVESVLKQLGYSGAVCTVSGVE